MTASVSIKHIDRLGVLAQKEKRIKVIVGSRASTKSTFVADHCLAKAANGARVCCAREYLNSIDDSVHHMLKDEIERLSFPGFDIKRSEIDHTSGGHLFHKGLARNITSLKGINCNILWIEEGEATSKETLKVLTASIRVSAKEQDQAKKEGREIVIPEIWITMNRGSSKDPIAVSLLKRAEKELARCGYYEDDLCIIMEVNYDENPWFKDSGLEVERADDERFLSKAAYDHKWKGAYSDTIENAIIDPAWFDACIDAHEKLGFKPEGIEVLAFDPFDGGSDSAAITYLHGSVFTDADLSDVGRVNDCCDWALDYANQAKPEVFTWDAGGVGAGLKRQISDSIGKKNIQINMFQGQGKIENPDSEYQPTPGSRIKAKKNREVFFNLRAQMYWKLRDRIFRTYLAVTDGTYTDPSELISFSSNIKVMSTLRAELCRIPLKNNGSGKIQIMSKDEMKKEGIDSPNIGDCCMMAMINSTTAKAAVKINFTGWNG